MCFVFIWEQTATCATYSINWLVFITEMKSVYSAVRTGALNREVWHSSLLKTAIQISSWLTKHTSISSDNVFSNRCNSGFSFASLRFFIFLRQSWSKLFGTLGEWSASRTDISFHIKICTTSFVSFYHHAPLSPFLPRILEFWVSVIDIKYGKK